jgi:16S rRNA processing protein RimM
VNAPDSTSTLVPLGVIVSAHGVRGELRVKLLNPASELIESLDHVWLRRTGDATRRVPVRSVHRHQSALLLVTIPDCSDRDAAEALRGTELCVPRAELPTLEPDEFYLVDLLGLEVRLPDGSPIGVVEDTIEYPASQVLRVRLRVSSTAADGPEEAGGVIEVPIFDPYVVEVQLDARAVIVDHLEDLEVEHPRRKDKD